MFDDSHYYETPDLLTCPNCEVLWEDPEKRVCSYCWRDGCVNCIKYNEKDKLTCGLCLDGRTL